MVDRVLVSATHNGRVVQQHAAGRIGSVMIGRMPQCDIVLESGDVSRTHAEISFDGDRFCIYDLGSANGVVLNDAEVDAAPLANGDVVRIGQFELHISIPTDEPDDGGDARTNFEMTIRAPDAPST